MTSFLPEDPYQALGVTRDATAAAIKTAYRKLVLKHHPDKVSDEAQKQSAADLFHKIQTAWETVGDEDKRTRYDAQCRLNSLRKEAVERDRMSPGTKPDTRPFAYRTATESRQRAPPSFVGDNFRTEEIRPQDAEFFDTNHRSSERRDYDIPYDAPKRTSPKESRHRSRLAREDSKVSQKARQREKVRQATKATARDRDHKYARAQFDVESDTDSDPRPYDRARRSPREEEDPRRTAEKYMEQVRKQQEEAVSGRYTDERTRKMFSEAREYIERTRSSRHAEVRRPSPTRTSSREQAEFLAKDSHSRPASVRRSSGRPRSSREDSDSRRRDPDRARRSSNEYDEPVRRPPGLSHTKSAPPHDIHIPLLEKQRSYSAHLDQARIEELIPPPVRRADSMPHAPSKRDDTRSKPLRSSTLRKSQLNDDYEPRKPSSHSYPAPKPPKEYADDNEYPTPDGYRTEVIEPISNRKITRSPSPLREKERTRTASKYKPSGPQVPTLNTRTKTYVYSPTSGLETVSPVRPSYSRADSGRKDSLFYGEIPTTRSHREREPYSAPPDGLMYREVRPDIENVKIQSGFSASRRPSGDGRSNTYTRSSSYTTPPMSA